MEDERLSKGNNMVESSGSKMGVVNFEDVEFPSHEELHSSNNRNLGEITSCGSMESIFDELLRNTNTHACTHFHTCNPPGPDFPHHSHTCVHMHTKIVAPAPAPSSNNDDDSSEYSREHNNKWDRGGNREAVRKYRQKKKAYTASLANELATLKAANQQLIQRLQSRAGLEAEVSRLKCLLVDIRGRIEGEIGSFPYQKPLHTPNMYPNIPNNTTNFPTSTNIIASNNENAKCAPDSDFHNLNCLF